MTSPSGALPRYRTLDAWRGIAALAVVAFHSFSRFPLDPLPAWFSPVRTVSQHGWMGVTLFFVISGYCIADQMARVKASDAGMKRFWLSRLLRIYPPYLAALAFAIALNALTTSFNHLPLASAFPISPMAWLGDLTLLHFPLGLPIYLTVSWSLAMEVGFYLVCGLGLLLPVRFFAVTGVALVLGALFNLYPRPLGFLNGWPEFFSGMIAYWVIRARFRAEPIWRGVAVLTLMGLVLIYRANLTGGLAALFAGVLIVLAPHDGALTRRLPVRGLAVAGTFSYSIYLIHLPVLSKLINFIARFQRPDSPFFPVGWAVAIAITLIVAWGFHRVIEVPAEKWRHRQLTA